MYGSINRYSNLSRSGANRLAEEAEERGLSVTWYSDDEIEVNGDSQAIRDLESDAARWGHGGIFSDRRRSPFA